MAILALGIDQPISAERSFYFEKVLDINKKSFEDSFTNLNNLPMIFEDNVKSVEIVSNENEKTNAKLILGVGGFSVNSQLELINNQNSSHIMKVISGDLKGTKISTTLKETWSYNGIPNEGTIVEIDMILHTSGYLSLIGLASDETILYSLDKSLADIVSYVKSNNDITDKSELFDFQNEPIKIKSDKKIKKRTYNR